METNSTDPWLRKCFSFLGGMMSMDDFIGTEERVSYGNLLGTGSSKEVFELVGEPERCVAFLKEFMTENDDSSSTGTESVGDFLSFGTPTLDRKKVNAFCVEAAKTTIIHYILDRIIARTAKLFQPRYYARVMRCYKVGITPDKGPYMIFERIPTTLEKAFKRYCKGQKEECTDEQVMDAQRQFCISLYQLAKTLNLLYKEIKFVHGDLKANNIGIVGMDDDPCSSVAVLLDFGLSTFRVDLRTCQEFGLQNELVVNSPRSTTTSLLNNDIAYLLVSTYTIWNRFVDSPTMMTSLTAFFDLVYANMGATLKPMRRRRITDIFPATHAEYLEKSKEEQKSIYKLLTARNGVSPAWHAGVYEAPEEDDEAPGEDDEGGSIMMLPAHLNQNIQLVAVKGILSSFTSLQCVRDMIDDEDGYIRAKTERLATLLQRMLDSSTKYAELVLKHANTQQELANTKQLLEGAVQKVQSLQEQLKNQQHQQPRNENVQSPPVQQVQTPQLVTPQPSKPIPRPVTAKKKPFSPAGIAKPRPPSARP